MLPFLLGSLPCSVPGSLSRPCLSAWKMAVVCLVRLCGGTLVLQIHSPRYAPFGAGAWFIRVVAALMSGFKALLLSDADLAPSCLTCGELNQTLIGPPEFHALPLNVFWTLTGWGPAWRKSLYCALPCPRPVKRVGLPVWLSIAPSNPYPSV